MDFSSVSVATLTVNLIGMLPIPINLVHFKSKLSLYLTSDMSITVSFVFFKNILPLLVTEPSCVFVSPDKIRFRPLLHHVLCRSRKLTSGTNNINDGFVPVISLRQHNLTSNDKAPFNISPLVMCNQRMRAIYRNGRGFLQATASNDTG